MILGPALLIINFKKNHLKKLLTSLYLIFSTVILFLLVIAMKTVIYYNIINIHSIIYCIAGISSLALASYLIFHFRNKINHNN